jgi:glutathione S-transferase
MKLMYLPTSPFARKVRVAAIELGLSDSIDPVVQMVAPTKENDEYARTVNPLRKVPALVLDDGRTIYDSTVICENMDAMAGGGKIIPASGPDRWETLTLHALAQGMTEAAVTVRYETAYRPDEYRWPDYVDDQWGRIEAGLDWIEANPKGLEGPINIAHIALGCLVGYLDFRWPERPWRDGRSRLGNWSAWIGRRDSFKQTMPYEAA